jgi:8-oxo-dGTP pyrophosphatase MutT (NUDIX family)
MGVQVGKSVPDQSEAQQQVAALCWRRAPRLEILLITTLRSRRWILPKGWPMPGLSLAQSAAREALEEAGVEGRIAEAPFASYSYLKEKKSGATACTVDIFALKVTSQRTSWAEQGERELVWLPPDRAARRVSEIALRRIILEFHKARAV